MHSIVLFLGKSDSFDVETASIIDQAFDQACKRLHDRGQPEVVREVLAKRIISLAKDGERDVARLCTSALASFGVEERRST